MEPKPSDPASERRSKKSHADKLVELVEDIVDLDLFHTPDGEPFATVPSKGHRETWRIQSKGFREWLASSYYAIYEKAPGSQALQDAINTLAGRAKFEGPERIVNLRVASHDGDIWIDLCHSEWRAVRITSVDWTVVASDKVPVRFVRRPGMQALPEPVRGGKIDELRPLLNLPDDAQWTLFVGWLVGAFRPRGPYGVLAVNGEAGSAKSTLCKLARRLLDPNAADLRRPPKDERDVFIAAGNSWVCSYNNVSGLSPELADAICALATDGGFATRTLYENDEETIFTARRPVILNGIDELGSRGDLLDRMVTLSLGPIPEERRRTEDEILSQFERVRPRVLGALLDAISSALRNQHSVRLARKPRMADLATWVTAAEESLGWTPGQFLAAYTGNREGANALAIESSPIGNAVVVYLETKPFEGTAGALLSELNHRWGSDQVPYGWPRNSKALATALRRLAPNLRASGYVVELPVTGEGRGKRRVFRLRKPSRAESGAEEAAHPPPHADHALGETVRMNCEQAQPAATPCEAADGADRADRHSPILSNAERGQQTWDRL